MTSSPSNGKYDTPQVRMNEVINRLACALVEMKKVLEEEHNIPTEELSEFMSLTGELTWMAGAVEATHVMAVRDDDGSRIIN